MLACLASALPAVAQTAAPAPASAKATACKPPDDQGVCFMARTQFHLGAEHLATDSEQFVWEGAFGGEVDFLDWGTGRAMFVGSYQVIMGAELKAFDPNQGNYILGFSGSARFAGNELSGVFHHESRHLSDRPKIQPVDWNMIGARLQRQLTAGALFLDTEGQFLGVIQKSYVDYRWEVDGRVRGDLILRPGVGVLLSADVRVLGVDGSRARGTQAGARGEGGLRFDGERGAVELFVAVERRVDPAQLEFGTMNWVAVGFRLLSR